MTYRRATRDAGPPKGPLPWRRSDADLRTLARDVIMGRAMVTNKEREVSSAFYMIAAMMDWSKVDRDKIAAVIGYMDSVVPGRAMNGFPIFLSMGFLHRDDVEAYDAHLTQMQEALQ